MVRHEKRASGTNEGRTDVFEVRIDGIPMRGNVLLLTGGGDSGGGGEVCAEEDEESHMVKKVGGRRDVGMCGVR